MRNFTLTEMIYLYVLIWKSTLNGQSTKSEGDANQGHEETKLIQQTSSTKPIILTVTIHPPLVTVLIMKFQIWQKQPAKNYFCNLKRRMIPISTPFWKIYVKARHSHQLQRKQRKNLLRIYWGLNMSIVIWKNSDSTRFSEFPTSRTNFLVIIMALIRDIQL